MEQLAFFAESGQSKGLPEDLLEYRPGFVDPVMSDELLKKFMAENAAAAFPCGGSEVGDRQDGPGVKGV